ncbi:MAG: hypothetical protein EHM33_15255 [Chloroflexi bacterium]|nr:MAG: hypothetical protein EHM33_15255 [Chloroflexota bacterium]
MPKYDNENLKKGDRVKFHHPYPDEEGLVYILLEDPSGGRVLVEAVVPMTIRPQTILQVQDLMRAE